MIVWERVNINLGIMKHRFHRFTQIDFKTLIAPILTNYWSFKKTRIAQIYTDQFGDTNYTNSQ